MSVVTKMKDEVMLEVIASEEREQTPSLQQQTRRSLMISQRVLTVIPPLVLGIIILTAWYASTTYGHINGLILPTVGEVLSSLASNLANGLFFNSALITIQESVIGFLLAVLIALPAGYGIARFRLFAATFQPYLAAGQAIPAIVIAPVLYLILGYGTITITILCMLIVLFPMVITTALGFQTIDQTLIDAARVEGASGWPMLFHIEFPLALPAILAAVRTGLTLSITGAIVGEFVTQGSTQGLGALILTSTEQYDKPLLFATLVILGVLAAMYYGASWLLVRLANAIY